MKKNKNTQRFGIFYRSQGKWTTTPYNGLTFTAHQLSRNPVKQEVKDLQNYILKSQVRIAPVNS